jgi:hypothetical protein
VVALHIFGDRNQGQTSLLSSGGAHSMQPSGSWEHVLLRGSSTTNGPPAFAPAQTIFRHGVSACRSRFPVCKSAQFPRLTRRTCDRCAYYVQPCESTTTMHHGAPRCTIWRLLRLPASQNVVPRSCRLASARWSPTCQMEHVITCTALTASRPDSLDPCASPPRI